MALGSRLVSSGIRPHGLCTRLFSLPPPSLVSKSCPGKLNQLRSSLRSWTNNRQRFCVFTVARSTAFSIEPNEHASIMQTALRHHLLSPVLQHQKRTYNVFSSVAFFLSGSSWHVDLILLAVWMMGCIFVRALSFGKQRHFSLPILHVLRRADNRSLKKFVE